MRGDIRQRGHLPQSGNPAHVVRVGLNDIHHGLLYEFAHAIRSHKAFAGCDRRTDAPCDARHSPDVLRRTRLLDPKQVQRVEFLDDHGGHAGAGLGMEIDRDIDIRAQAFAQDLDVAYRLGDLLVGLDPFVVIRQAAFERGDPLRLRPSRAAASGRPAFARWRRSSRARLRDRWDRRAAYKPEHRGSCRADPIAPGRARKSRNPSPGRRDKSCGRTSTASGAPPASDRRRSETP